MVDGIIFDLGMNNGDDTDFYLKKGFRVVAVEANPELCTRSRQRFAAQIAARQLHVVNAAVAATAGELELFVNEDVSGWSTANPAWLQERRRQRTRTRTVTVQAITLHEIVREHGLPYYLKADIQGAEIACLQALLEMDFRPQYVSISAGSDVLRKGAIRHVRAQLQLLSKIGYNRFQIVAQQDTRLQKCPWPAREGVYADHTFSHGSSGLFGRELPGRWIDADAALREHRRIAWSYRLAGHSRSPAGWLTRIPGEQIKFGLDRLFWRGLGWYDTHATRSDENP